MADAKDVVLQGWDAYRRHDLDGVLEAYAEDAELIVPGAPPARGRDEIRATWKGFLDAFPDDSPTIEKTVREGDTVVVVFTTTGTNTGPLAMPTGESIPATGRRVELSGVSVAEVADDKVVRETFYWDNASFLTQLGLMPEPTAAAM